MDAEGQEFGFVRSTLLDNLSVMEYHRRTLDMVASIDEQIKRLTEDTNVSEDHRWKNPREESIHLHNVKTLSVLKRQKERLMDKLTQIQERIQEDIEASNCVTPLKPLKKL